MPIVATPSYPNSFTATRNDDTQATLSWNSGTMPDSQSWDKLETRRWDNVSNAWGSWSSRPLTNGSVSVTTGISANRQYRWQIRSHNAAGYSTIDTCDPIQTTPAAPSGISASLMNATTILVSWTNGASTTNGYEYQTEVQESVNGGSWTTIITVGATANSYARASRTAGSTYAYRVRAKSTVGSTTYSSYTSSSASIQVHSVPPAPSGISVSRTSDTNFTISWTDNPNGTVAPYTAITLQRLDSPSGTWATIANLAGTATSFNDTSTTANHYYQWRVSASNDAGTSAYATSSAWQTQPADPTNPVLKAVPSGLQFTWDEPVGYTNYSTTLRYYKDGVLQTDTISVSAGTKTYTLTGVTLTSTYKFGVKLSSTTGYSSVSNWVDSASVPASTPPNAPTNLAPSGSTIDAAKSNTLTWKHSPGTDGSDQTAFQVRWSTNGGSTWTTSAKITSTSQSYALAAGTVANGQTLTWQVATYGVSTTIGPWSASASVNTSATPIVTITTPSSTTLTTSVLVVNWTYSDAESTAQSYWAVELYDQVSGKLLEQKSGNDASTSVTLSTAIVDSGTYTLKVRVQDGSGLYSNWVTMNLTGSFTPPAVPLLDATYDNDSGVTILTLTPIAVTPGVTVAASSVNIQRQILDLQTGAYGDWETIASNVAPDATLIDTTAPLAGDGQYRTVVYSAIPSTRISDPVVPDGQEDFWVYVSGGDDFRTVCRFYGNISMSRSVGRTRSYYNFAGRKKPVAYASDTTQRSQAWSGVLDDQSSTPDEWEALIENCDVLLLRSPLGHRIYGSIDQLDTSMSDAGIGLHDISFTITEVDNS